MKIGGTTTNPRAGLFVPTMKVQSPAPLQLAPQLATEAEVLSPPGPLGAGVVEGSVCLVPGGRLSTFWQVWEAKNAHPRVVTILKEGYCLNFRVKPPLTKYPVIRSKYLNREKQQFLIKAVYQMIDKKAITPVQKVTSLGFYSRLFLVPKPGKKWQPVIDLSVVNNYLHVPTFKMETAENIRDSFQQGEWVTSLDLTDAYFHIPIHPRFQKYLRFNVGDRSYQFTALPFGIATAPLEFTMVAKGVKADGSYRRHQNSPVHRRLITESKVETTMPREYPQVDSSCRKLGLDNKFPKIRFSSNSRNPLLHICSYLLLKF